MEGRGVQGLRQGRAVVAIHNSALMHGRRTSLAAGSTAGTVYGKVHRSAAQHGIVQRSRGTSQHSTAGRSVAQRSLDVEEGAGGLAPDDSVRAVGGQGHAHERAGGGVGGGHLELQRAGEDVPERGRNHLQSVNESAEGAGDGEGARREAGRDRGWQAGGALPRRKGTSEGWPLEGGGFALTTQSMPYLQQGQLSEFSEDGSIEEQSRSARLGRPLTGTAIPEEGIAASWPGGGKL